MPAAESKTIGGGLDQQHDEPLPERRQRERQRQRRGQQQYCYQQRQEAAALDRLVLERRTLACNHRNRPLGVHLALHSTDSNLRANPPGRKYEDGKKNTRCLYTLYYCHFVPSRETYKNGSNCVCRMTILVGTFYQLI
jgi:hypothetical protein